MGTFKKEAEFEIIEVHGLNKVRYKREYRNKVSIKWERFKEDELSI